MKYIVSMALFIFLTFDSALAAKVHGRASFGTLAATERFTETNTASNKNDYLVSSTRLYTKVSEINSSYWSFTADVRDKNDFFDKLNQEKLQLDNKNEFQAKQLYVARDSAQANLNFNIGRFPVLEAGGAYTDGALVNYKFTSSWSAAAFAGLNPKRTEQTYVQYNPNSNVQGAYFSYQSRSNDWGKNLFFTNAYVNQSTNGETDRTYFYNSTSYQWNLNSRLISMFYVDFAPRTNVQVGSLYWRQVLTPKFLLQMNLLGIDVIEYTRRQNVRERLTPSPYREGQLKFDFASNSNDTWELGVLGGRREIDQKSKAQAHLAFFKNKIFGPKWDGSFRIGSRQNFTSNDQFLHLGLGYFSRLWEGQLDIEYANEKYTDNRTLQPLTTELSYSHYFTKSTYATLSFLRAAEQEVEILSSFFRIGYRWGTQEIPPIRDGAPPRGAL